LRVGCFDSGDNLSFPQNDLLALMQVKNPDESTSSNKSGDFVLVDFGQDGSAGDNLVVLLSQRVQVGIKLQDTGIILDLSPLNDSIIPRVLDNGPFDNDVLFAFDNVVHDQSF
jgi:hypothetical protein